MNPKTVSKQHLMYESLILTGAANSVALDARGMEDMVFILEALDLATGGSFSNETLDVHIEGRQKTSDAWVDVPGLVFTQIAAVSGGQMIPTQVNGGNMHLPRYLRVALVSAGTADIVTVNVLVRYNRPRHGKRVLNAPLS